MVKHLVYHILLLNREVLFATIAMMRQAFVTPSDVVANRTTAATAAGFTSVNRVSIPRRIQLSLSQTPDITQVASDEDVSIPRRVQLSLSPGLSGTEAPLELRVSIPRRVQLSLSPLNTADKYDFPVRFVSIPRRVQLSLSLEGSRPRRRPVPRCLNPPKGPALVVTLSLSSVSLPLRRVSIPRRVQLSLSQEAVCSEESLSPSCLNPPKGPALVVTVRWMVLKTKSIFGLNPPKGPALVVTASPSAPSSAQSLSQSPEGSSSRCHPFPSTGRASP